MDCVTLIDHMLIRSEASLGVQREGSRSPPSFFTCQRTPFTCTCHHGRLIYTHIIKSEGVPPSHIVVDVFCVCFRRCLACGFSAYEEDLVIFSVAARQAIVTVEYSL